MSSATLLMAGGGSGGHVFPLLSVADALSALLPELRLVFVGTERGLERQLVPARGYELECLPVSPIRGAAAAGAARAIVSAGRAVLSSRRLIERLSPRAVFSVGGYAAGPVALAAFTKRVPLALLEPNADIGLANRWVSPLVNRAYVAFPETRRFFREEVVLETGVPLRPGFVPREAEPTDTLRVLVLGGSQGAKTLNEAVPRALARLALPLRVLHQCGRAHARETEALYAELELGARAVVTPFIEDVNQALADADLVVGRAGAGALAEICVVGRPSLLVPYPFAGDHQRFNAISLSERGAARYVLAAEASPERLEREIGALLADRQGLSEMGRRARALGRPDAAAVIAKDLLTLAGLAHRAPCVPARVSNEPGSSVPLTVSEVV